MDQGTEDVIRVEREASPDYRVGPQARLDTAVADHPIEQPGIEGVPVAQPPSRRDKIEVLGILLGMLGIILGLALTVGRTLPFGP